MRAPASQPPRVDPDRIAIVAAERGPSGIRLVAIDEHGDRQVSLIAPPAPGMVVRDTHPAVSPDGRWIAFASSRERAELAQTSLWIAPLGEEQPPVRLTATAAIDTQPAWASDGSYLVYASAAPGGTFDLYRLPIRAGRAAGPPEPLTAGAGQEITPAVASDGTIVYTAVTPTGAGVESHLEQRAPDGAIAALTEGPADSSPAISPDGSYLAFARPGLIGERANVELWLLRHGTTEPTLLVALPLTDESGPVWSRDGRFVFATSIVKGEQGVLFSSVIHADITEPEARRHARMLVDRAGAVPRLTPAIVAPVLDARALHADPEYLSELARLMAHAIESRSEQAAPDGAPAAGAP